MYSSEDTLLRGALWVVTLLITMLAMALEGSYFEVTIMSLMLVLYLAFDDGNTFDHLKIYQSFKSLKTCSPMVSKIFERFEDSTSVTSPTPAPSQATDTLAATTTPTGMQALPWSVYNTMSPSLDRVASVIRGDAGTSAESTTTDLKSDLYTSGIDAATLHAGDGSVDAGKFDAMKLEYKQIVTLLCRMKNLAPEAHRSLIIAIGGC